MKTPIGTEVDLGQDRLYRWGLSSRERGTAAPLFSAHIYCGHGRPSQLLLSSCCIAHSRASLYFAVGRPFPIKIASSLMDLDPRLIHDIAEIKVFVS